jgi:amino acid adenylation domain-containing protein
LSALLHERFVAQARDRADALAVTLDADELTYGELDRLSDAIAAALVARGAAAGDRAALFVPKSPAAVAAMLGCSKAGCVYVPIDLGSPAPRLARIVAAADPAFVVVGADARAALDAVRQALPERCATLELDAVEPAAAPPAPAVDATSPAHILFTSGSTGVPKGVVITHANVAAFLDWAVPYFAIGPDDRLSGHAPLHFDLSTFDVFGALSTGAELHLVPPRANLLPRDLAAFVEQRRLTQWFSVPTVLAYMAKLDAIPPGGFSTVRRIIWCGDVLPTPVLRTWMERHPHASFTNLYGPTEATIASSFHTVEEIPADDAAPIPIGRACAGEQLLVLDEDLDPVPAGETGDLYIAGAGLSPGYWRDPEKTAEAFLDAGAGRIYRTGDLARVGDDGLVYFVGRADSQIKSRGHRIELGEIEAAANTLPEVAEVAVVAVETGDFDGKAICCAWAPSTDAGAADTLRAPLRELLPAYMIPSRWLRLETLPKNANGKIDRRVVRELFDEVAAASGARGEA